MNPTFYINHETCSKCGICVEVCPALVLGKNEQKDVDFIEQNLDLCLQCGQCMAVCKTKSIHTNGMTYENDFFEFTEKEPFMSLVEQRRSVRHFKAKPLEQEVLDKLIYTISMTPHGDSHPHVEITVINNRNKIMEALPLFVSFYKKMGGWLHNPFMRYMIKKNAGDDVLKTLKYHILPRIEKGVYRDFNYEYDGITRGTHTLLLFHAPKDAEEHKEDAMIMVTYAMLAAQSLGLGATIIGLVPPALNKNKIIRRIFHIPDDHETVISLIVGYPKYKYLRGIKRNLKRVEIFN